VHWMYCDRWHSQNPLSSGVWAFMHAVSDKRHLRRARKDDRMCTGLKFINNLRTDKVRKVQYTDGQARHWSLFHLLFIYLPKHKTTQENSSSDNCSEGGTGQKTASVTRRL
jgi:hypothetical protein